MFEGARAEFRREQHEPQPENWPPEQVGYLWDWFNELSDWRDLGFGVGALSHQEIECWGRLMRIDPQISPFEVDVLRTLDRECRAFHNEKNDPDNKQNNSSAPIAQSLEDMKAAHEAEMKAREKLKKRAKK